MTEPKLKPCAHCNNIASLIKGHVGYYCLCEGCGMQTPIITQRDDAIEIWNTRHDK